MKGHFREPRGWVSQSTCPYGPRLSLFSWNPRDGHPKTNIREIDSNCSSYRAYTLQKILTNKRFSDWKPPAIRKMNSKFVDFTNLVKLELFFKKNILVLLIFREITYKEIKNVNNETKNIILRMSNEFFCLESV